MTREEEILSKDFWTNNFSYTVNHAVICAMREYARETNIEKDKRIKELEWQADEIIRTAGNAQDTLIKEIERLKGLVEYVHKQFSFLDDEAWQQFKTENQL